MTLGKAGVARRCARPFRSAHRRGGRRQRRYLRHRRSPARQQSSLEIFQGREVHQDLGQERIGSRRVLRASHHRDRFAAAGFSWATGRIIESRSSIRTAATSTRGCNGDGPAESYIAKDDTMYVADSESYGPDQPGVKKGIRIGSAKDGSVKAFIEDMESTTQEHSGAEGVGVDAQGNVYGAVVRRKNAGETHQNRGKVKKQSCVKMVSCSKLLRTGYRSSSRGPSARSAMCAVRTIGRPPGLSSKEPRCGKSPSR